MELATWYHSTTLRKSEQQKRKGWATCHGFTGKQDSDLETAFGINPALSSEYITYYLEDNIFTGGANTCGN